MAKTAIHEQAQALSNYFEDMLAEPSKAVPAPVIDTVDESEQVGSPEPLEDNNISPAEPTPRISAEPPISVTSVARASHYKLLLCEIGTLPVAIDVEQLNNIVHWPKQGLSQMSGQPAWHLGLLTARDQQTEVVDIQHILHKEAIQSPMQGDYILLVDQRRLGIVCDRIQHIVTIEQDAINWHEEQDAWSVGMINDSMHTILDIPSLLTALKSL